MKHWKRTTLLDLPILPEDRDEAAQTDHVLGTFVKERGTLIHPSQLRSFVRKWSAIWLLCAGPHPASAPPGCVLARARSSLSKYTRMLLEGHYDAKRVFRFLNHKDSDPLVETDSRDFRIAGYLAMPPPMMLAWSLANSYGAGTDIGFVRLYLDTYSWLNDKGRPFRRTSSTEDEVRT